MVHEYVINISAVNKERLFLQSSMSKKGDCWDNAVAESFLKTPGYSDTYTDALAL